jgi:hypothetical protein
MKQLTMLIAGQAYQLKDPPAKWVQSGADAVICESCG